MRHENRRQFLTQVTGGIALGMSGLAAIRPGIFADNRAGKPLNFIFILIDDMGWTDLGCYGSPFYESPHIDELARQGMRFTNGYAACPVCSPSRAAILTGKHPARLHLTDWLPGRKSAPFARIVTPVIRQELPVEEVTLPEVLKPAGYACASIGKWHLGGDGERPLQQGFDLNIGGTASGHARSYFGPFDLPGLKGGTTEDYLVDRLEDETEKFLETHRDRPFFLYLPNFAVHIPLQAKKDMIAAFDAKSKPVKGHQNSTYGAMIKNMDDAVGRLMRKLDELEIADHTAIIFTSDNGGLMYEGKRQAAVTSNAPLRAGKGHVYEGGIRVPLIVRWPGVVEARSTCVNPVSGVDFFPTILEMAGVPGPAGPLDGESLAPLLKQSGKLGRTALYWHYPHFSNQGGLPAGAIRQGELKLLEFYEDGHLELYNLDEDPGERTNLAEKMPEKARELHLRLRRWRESVRAQMPSPNPNHDPAQAGEGLTGTDPARQWDSP